jgi:hypothetical protein
MGRIYQLLEAGNFNAEDDDFWGHHWPHIASAKVSLETKVAAYHTLSQRGVVAINTVGAAVLYEMIVADRAFVARLDLDTCQRHCYHVFIAWIDDDVAALIDYYPTIANDPAMYTHSRYDFLWPDLRYVMMKVNAPRCIRFMLQDKAFREMVLLTRMSPLVLQLAEELVQPTDRLDSRPLVVFGQSVKLIGMCVPDEELVAVWLKGLRIDSFPSRKYMSVALARKLHALATPEQNRVIEDVTLHAIYAGISNDVCFELVHLFGLLYPSVQTCFRKNKASWFPMFTFAMIVAVCDGYLKATHSGISEQQRRFFALVTRLPMDLQALISLRLWGRTSTVIRGDTFNRAFVTII